MAIKLICTDMDGTLLNSDHTVSDENKKALKEAIDEGITVSIATGRLFTSANFYRQLIGIDAPLICSNGAYIKNRKTGEILYQNPLTLEESLQLFHILNKYNLNLFFNTWNTAISNKEFINNHAYLLSNEGMEEEDKTKFIINKDLEPILKDLEGNVLKAICIDYSKENIEEVQKARLEIESLGLYEVVCSSPFNFEVMRKGTTKGSAVKALAKLLNIKREEVLCLGDSENDLSMIEYAGTGVAMGNAMDIIKEKAQFITSDNNSSGVAKAIRHFIKKKSYLGR